MQLVTRAFGDDEIARSGCGIGDPAEEAKNLLAKLALVRAAQRVIAPDRYCWNAEHRQCEPDAVHAGFGVPPLRTESRSEERSRPLDVRVGHVRLRDSG